MSEPLPGIPAPPPAGKVRDASAIVLFRHGEAGPELFWVRRGAKLNFSGGFFAFPGGRVDRDDAELAVVGASGEDARFIAGAARELFEETGVLVVTPQPDVGADALAMLRRDLLDEKTTFAKVLETLDVEIDGPAFRPAGRWVTPPYLPIRFDTRFYVVELPEAQSAEVWPGELSEGAWIRPGDALARWQEGSALLHPPQLHAFQVFDRFTDLDSAIAQLVSPPNAPGFIAQRIEFQRGIFLMPQPTPTLPPATHTNCYVIGADELIVVDPGAHDPREQARLAAFVTGLTSEGRRLRAIVLTHHHTDHIGGAMALKERLKLPIWAHELTASRVPGVERILNDGEVLKLAGQPPMELEVLHTPGHARGHIVLREKVSGALVVGDMVAGVGSIIIDPPEGDLTDYLASLERLIALPAGVLYPAHGPVIVDGVQKLREYVLHRQMREARIYEALQSGARSVQELVSTVYTDTPPELHPLAERSALASLIKLIREGKVERQGEKYGVPA